MPRAEPGLLPAETLAPLRAQAAALPDTPGVYLFWGRSPTLPLYIGKSVQLRSRVLAHLRDPSEQRWVRQALHIEHRPTVGEVGALLLEAALIKQLQPLHNVRLRRTRQLCAWQLPADGPALPQLVQARDLDFARAPDLHGLFTHPAAARAALQALADRERLCLQRLGLERGWRAGACFRASLGHCAGVCAGREAAEAHDARLRAALADSRVLSWPHPGPVALVERNARGEQALHVLQHWCHLGTASDWPTARRLARVSADFDVDSYRILSQGVLREGAELLPLD